MIGAGPTTTRRRLRAELRSLRLAKKLSVEDVVSEVEWSTSKLIRIENGQVSISVSDLTALLRLYGPVDAVRENQLKQLARASKQRRWWSGYQRYLSAPYLAFIGYESDSTSIRQYHPTMVPGLLQTEEYARAVNEAIGSVEPADGVLEAQLKAAMMRQRHVLHRPDPPRFVALIDEAALRRPVGGPAVMRDQLNHLVKLSAQENVTMVVVPFQAGPHRGLLGPFALMEYADPLNDDVVAVGHHGGTMIVQDQPDVIKDYRQAADDLVDLGLHGEDAIRFIQEVLRELS